MQRQVQTRTHVFYLCNFMKSLLGGKKIANATALARALSVFGGSFVTFFCKSGSHRLVTLFVAAQVSSNQLSFYRWVLNHSQFNIYPIIHLYFGIFRYLLFILELLFIHYSQRQLLHYSLFVSIFHRYSLFIISLPLPNELLSFYVNSNRLQANRGENGG